MPSLREAMLTFAPSWLQTDDGEKLLTVIGALLDAQMEWTHNGIFARFPRYRSTDTLAEIGHDRRIPRGAFEDNDTYAERLRRWLDLWLYAGNPFAILGMIQAYLAPYEVPMRLVNDRGSWYTLLPDGTREWLLAEGNWDWSSLSSNHPTPSWSRFWVILYPPHELWSRGPLVDDAELWDGAVDSPGYTIGTTAKPEQVASILQIIKLFKDAKSRCQNVIISFDPDAFAPTDTAPPNPDGWWGNASRVVSGERVPTRLEDAEYWYGTGPQLREAD